MIKIISEIHDMKKRAFERVDSNIQVNFLYNNATYTGIVTNLSENGMRINTNNCLPIKSQFKVLVPLKVEILNIHATVSRLVKKYGSSESMGVELLNHPREYLDFVRNFRLESSGKLSKEMNQEISIYTCKVCNHIVFEQLPIECPMCMASIENFEINPDALKRPEDPESLGEFEKKHIPIINISKTNDSNSNTGYNVHVKVGEIKHPMEIEDHITFIDYYIQDPDIKKRCLGRMNLRCSKIQPSTMFYLDNLTSANIIVISKCTAHGSWMSQVTI